MIRTRLAPLLLPLAMGGCAGDVGYSSLAPRPVETREWADKPTPPPAAVPADPALDQRIEAATSALADSRSAFAAADARAAPRVAAARGTAAGSERWIAAQESLAGLDAARAATADAAGSLDDLASARGLAMVADYPALEAARAAAAAQLDAEMARIRTLGEALAPG